MSQLFSAKVYLLVILCVLLGGSVMFGVTRSLCDTPLGFSFWSNPDKVSSGYVLVAPYNAAPNRIKKEGEVQLLDERGAVAHAWTTPHPVLMAYLQPNGHLYVAMTPPSDVKHPSPGTTGLVQELDWDGNVVWEYTDLDMTHDFEIMPDGGIAYTRWAKASPAFAAQVRGGMGKPAEIWTNEVIVVNRDKEIIWTWDPEDHLAPQKFTLSPLVPRNDWIHLNSIRYTDANPVSGTPAFMISSRHLNTVFIIDATTGKVIWQSLPTMFATQHDATFLENGNILVFDNGLFRDSPQAFLASRAVEIDPIANEVVWKFPDGSSLIEVFQFSSSIMGGAQRLPNGNTLITESTDNTIVEVTPEADVVWSYTNDFRDTGEPSAVFKVRKYSTEGTEWGTWVSAPSVMVRMCR